MKAVAINIYSRVADHRLGVADHRPLTIIQLTKTINKGKFINKEKLKREAES